VSNAIGKLAISGSVNVIPIRRGGFCGLRASFFKGAWRGLHGTGVIGVGRLYASVIRADGGVEHLGLVCTKVITNAGVTFLRDDWNNNAQDFTTFNFHGMRHRRTAENVTDTALGAESTTGPEPGQHARDRHALDAGEQQSSARSARSPFDAGSRDHRARALQPGGDRRRHALGPLRLQRDQRRCVANGDSIQLPANTATKVGSGAAGVPLHTAAARLSRS
jgi:hypothetical protein